VWTTQRRAYIALRRHKRDTFWQNKIDAKGHDPRQLWRPLDALLGRGRAPPCDAIGAVECRLFFDGKVDGVRTLTADAPPPSFTPAPPGCSMFDFRSLTVDNVVTAVRALPDKQSASDPFLARLLKDNVGILAPFLVEQFGLY